MEACLRTLEPAKVANPARERSGWMLAPPKLVERKARLRALRVLAVGEQTQLVVLERTG